MVHAFSMRVTNIFIDIKDYCKFPVSKFSAKKRYGKVAEVTHIENQRGGKFTHCSLPLSIVIGLGAW